MLYGYSRVSTKGQARDGNSLADQKSKLIEAGVAEENIYADAFTGTKSERPEFSRLLRQLREGDTLVVCKLDRFARSAADGIRLVDELLAKGVKVNVLNMGVMDNSTTGKLIRGIFFCFAEFERDMIVERTQAGKAVARENPLWREGRKPADVKKLRMLIASGKSVAECCAEVGCSRSTYYKYAKEIA